MAAKPFRLYLCFCAEFYTGESRGEWHQEQPPYQAEEGSAYERPAQCHQWDGCGYYAVTKEDNVECITLDNGEESDVDITTDYLCDECSTGTLEMWHRREEDNNGS